MSPGETLNILSHGGTWVLGSGRQAQCGEGRKAVQEGGLEMGEEAAPWSDRR